MIDRLGTDPQCQEVLFREASGGDDTPKIEAFINETLRCYPPTPFVVREVVAPAQFRDTVLARGQLLLLSVVGIHRAPAFWRFPNRFDPEREEFRTGSYDRRAFIPFLTGPRSCGGAKLARIELSEGLKAFLRIFSVERNGPEFAFDYALALRPRMSFLTFQRRGN
jgi:cytochrome P450